MSYENIDADDQLLEQITYECHRGRSPSNETHFIAIPYLV
jgi:hypothetical protein